MKKVLVSVMAVLLSIGVFAANVELRVVTMFGGTDPAAKVYQAQLEDFKAKNPGVSIIDESMRADDTFKTKVRTDFTSGNEPDLAFYFTGSMGQDIIDTGKVVALDSLLAGDKAWKGDFSEGALNFIKGLHKKVYAVPVTGFAEGMFVQKALFDKYNLPLPTTWENFTKAIKKFKEVGITPISFPCAASPAGEPHYMIETMILSAAGAKGHDDKMANGANPNWAKGLDYIKELYEMGAFSKDVFALSENQNRAAFGSGKAAMMINGSWAAGSADVTDETKKTAVMLPVPVKTGSKGKYGDMIGGFGAGWFMSTKAYNDAGKKKAVVALLKHLTSKKSILDIAEANGGIPAVKGEVKGQNPLVLSIHAAIANSKNVAFPVDSQISSAAWNEIKDNLPQIMTSRKTSKEVLAAAYEKEQDSK